MFILCKCRPLINVKVSSMHVTLCQKILYRVARNRCSRHNYARGMGICRGVSCKFLSGWHILHNITNRIPYVKVIKVDRLNYVYMCKYKMLTPIKVNIVRSTSYKNPAQSLHETNAVDKSVHGSELSTRVCRANFCLNDMFYATFLMSLRT